MDNELKQYLVEMEGRLNARIEKAETNLLTAFRGWARSMEIRVRGVSSVTAGFDERLALAKSASPSWSGSGSSTANSARASSRRLKSLAGRRPAPHMAAKIPWL